MNVEFKLDPKPTVVASWHEVYIRFDKGDWYAVGGAESPVRALILIDWYRKTYGY